MFGSVIPPRDENWDFYADPHALGEYVAYRDRGTSRNAVIEEVPFLRLVGDVEGAACVDVGAGYGHYSEILAARGANVTAFDRSSMMVELAKGRNTGGKVKYSVADMTAVDFPDATFDLAISNMAFHYVLDLEPIFARVFSWLRPGGRFVFSVEHPMLTTSREEKLWCSLSARRHWVVTDYFDEADRWGLFGLKYHHTMATWINAPVRCGFVLREIAEPAPTPEAVALDPSYAEDLDRPLFLLVSLNKPERT